MPVDQLVLHANNARMHPDSQIKQLRESLRAFGFLSPIVIDGDGNVLAGRGRLMAAKAESMAYVPCVIAEDLTPEQRQAYILADNRLSESAVWDMDLVNSELAALADIGFQISVVEFDLEESPKEAPSAAKGSVSEPEPVPERLGHTCTCPECGHSFKVKL